MDNALRGLGFATPMGAFGGATVTGFDELGRPVYRDATGATYAVGAQPQPSQELVRLLGLPEDPQTPSFNVLSFLTSGFTAPGNALRGETVTLGDVWDTAGTAALGAQAMPAPDGSLRALNLRMRGDYVGDHTAPRLMQGATLDSPADIWGDDIYRREAVQWFGTGDPSLDRQSVSVIQRARSNPDADVVIYRAVPADAPDDINAGDWVTTSERYARDHGESWLDGRYKIVREIVKAGELATDGNSVHEWGWWPSAQRMKAAGMSDADIQNYLRSIGAM